MTTIDRPISLTPVNVTIFGNVKSKALVEASYNEAFKCYEELINDGWLQENAIRSAHMTLVGSIEAKLHMAIAGVER